LNLVLWKYGVIWREEVERRPNKDHMNFFPERKLNFEADSKMSFLGQSESGLCIKALPANLFWRNECVLLDMKDVVVFHPNSAKDETQKLETFRRFGIV
jgi:hypothetical protein